MQDGKVIYHAQAEDFKTREEKVATLLKKGSYTIERIAEKTQLSKGAVSVALVELHLKRAGDQPSRFHEFTLQPEAELDGVAKTKKRLQTMFEDPEKKRNSKEIIIVQLIKEEFS